MDIAGGAICLDILQVHSLWLRHPLCIEARCTERNKITFSSLQDKWSAVYSVHTILLSLQSLLGGMFTALYKTSWHCINDRAEPNNASPLNSDAATLWDTPEGKTLHLPYLIPILTLQCTTAAFKVQLMKHYRLPSDTSA